MQFHHHGYVSSRPPHPACGRRSASTGPTDLPDEMDVLIVGSGPAGMLAGGPVVAVLRVSPRGSSSVALGVSPSGRPTASSRAAVETFQAFGFAERIIAEEAYRITEMNFWAPGRRGSGEDRPQRPGWMTTPHGISEFPHLVVNQARVLDYFAEVRGEGAGARWHPTMVSSSWGSRSRTRANTRSRSQCATSWGRGRDRNALCARSTSSAVTVRAAVYARRSDASTSAGSRSHAWGVMDVLAVTDFPDVRVKCAIQSRRGQHPAHTSRGRAPVPHVRRSRRRRPRGRPRGGADDSDRGRSSRRRRRSCAPTPSM